MFLLLNQRDFMALESPIIRISAECRVEKGGLSFTWPLWPGGGFPHGAPGSDGDIVTPLKEGVLSVEVGCPGFPCGFLTLSGRPTAPRSILGDAVSTVRGLQRRPCGIPAVGTGHSF